MGFTVRYEVESVYEVWIEADTEEEAIEKFERGEWKPRDVQEIDSISSEPLNVTKDLE